MPKIGEIRKSVALSKNKRNGYMKYIRTACIDCGKERWVQLVKGKPDYEYCYPCGIKHRNMRGNRNPFWKGGKGTDRFGYVWVLLQPDNFFYSMTNHQGLVREHRLIMAKYLGRNLHSWEIVHHRNSIRNDNSLENLQLVTDDRHKQITVLERRIKYLEGLCLKNGIKV